MPTQKNLPGALAFLRVPGEETNLSRCLEERKGRKRAFCEQNGQGAVEAYNSIALHVLFHLFLCLLGYVARAMNYCLIGTPKI
jgi:hypothetical protein